MLSFKDCNLPETGESNRPNMWKLNLGVLFTLLLFSSSAHSQTISVSPYSFALWGSIEGISEVSVEVQFVGFHYFYSWDNTEYRNILNKELVTKTSSFAISIVPLRMKYFRLGGIFFDNKFPISNASKYNLLLEVQYPIGRFAVSYKHISNGFSLFNETNPGYDTLSLKFRF